MHLFGLPTVCQNYIEEEEEEEKREMCVCTCVCMHTGCNPGHRRESQPVKDGANTGTVSAAPVDVEACGQQDAVLDRNRAVGEGSDQQFIPPCEHREETLWGERPHPCLPDSRATHGLSPLVMKAEMEIVGGHHPAQGDTHN